jgi:hypothetical protein
LGEILILWLSVQVKHVYADAIFYLGLLTYIQKYRDKTAKNCRLVVKPNPVEYIRFALGFANAGQIGGNYCEQNALSTINGLLVV